LTDVWFRLEWAVETDQALICGVLSRLPAMRKTIDISWLREERHQAFARIDWGR